MTKHSFPIYAAAIAIAVTAAPAFAGAGNKGHGHGAMPTKTAGGHAHGGHGGHGDAQNSHAMNAAVGEKGDPDDVQRSINVTMKDNSYAPMSITVSKGETVRFIVQNTGELVHEFNIGLAEMHKSHQAEMMAMADSGALEADRIVNAKMGHMKHDDPNSVLLEPGKTGEVIWKFGTSGDIQFACNVPGHYEAGMHGMFKVQ